MRLTIAISLGAAVLAAIATLAVPPALAETVCETVGCSTECWMVGPGHRRCARRCLRHCRHYEEPPAYEPEPEEECCDSAEPEEPQVYEADTSEPDPEPEAEPEYTYSPPATPTASPAEWRPPYQSSPDIPAAGGLLVVLVVVALLVIAVITNKGNASSLERDVRETRALTQRLNAAAREADAHIAAFLKKEGIDG